MGAVHKILGGTDTRTPAKQRSLGKLYQMYGVHATTRQAVKQGYRVARKTKTDGTIQLQIAV